MYRIVTDAEVDGQVQALPDELLPYYAQLLDLLELAPWHTDPYNEVKPDGIMRTALFGPPGRTAQAVFLIIDGDQRVEIVRIVWIH